MWRCCLKGRYCTVSRTGCADFVFIRSQRTVMIRSKKNSSKREKDNSARVTYLDQQQQQVNDIGSVDSDTNFDQLIAKHSSTILKATVPDTNYGELADEASARGLRISRKMKHLMEKKDKEWYNYKIINEPQFDFQNPSQIPYRYVMTNQVM